MKKVFISFLTIYLFFIGCRNNDSENIEIRLKDVSYKIHTLHCETGNLKDSITIKWKTFNTLLEANVPPEMPEREKRNLLQLSNAPLIRIFKWYNRLDDNIKHELRKVEIQDSLTVITLLEISSQLKELEGEKIQLLMKLEKKDKARLDSINQELFTIIEKPCL